MGGAEADDEAIMVVRVAEPEIGANLSSRLQSLLQACFPGYPGRSYFKLPPHFRYLAMTGSGGVAGQMGVEFRVIRVGDAVVRTFGVVDLCVAETERSRGTLSPTRMTRNSTPICAATSPPLVIARYRKCGGSLK